MECTNAFSVLVAQHHVQVTGGTPINISDQLFLCRLISKLNQIIQFDRNEKNFKLRWIVDSRDEYAKERLSHFRDAFTVYRCHTILNCTKVCPKVRSNKIQRRNFNNNL